MRCPTLQELPPPPPGKTGWPWTEETPAAPATAGRNRRWERITIVTPSYNQGRYIEETIRSVLLQGYPDLEYIVLDGGSNDQSIDIIRTYEPWLSYWRSERDDGQSAALADGFRRATGGILAWLNSDDRYRPGALIRIGRFFAAQPRVVFGSGDVNLIDVAGRYQNRIYAMRPSRLITANLGIHIWPQQGCFWRRSAYEHVGGIDRSLRFCMDRDLFLRLISIGPGRRIPGPPLGDFRIHEEAKSSTILDVAHQEHTLLISRYSNTQLRPWMWLLRLWWQLWYKPVGLRNHLHRTFGWEW